MGQIFTSQAPTATAQATEVLVEWVDCYADTRSLTDASVADSKALGMLTSSAFCETLCKEAPIYRRAVLGEPKDAKAAALFRALQGKQVFFFPVCSVRARPLYAVVDLAAAIVLLDSASTDIIERYTGDEYMSKAPEHEDAAAMAATKTSVLSVRVYALNMPHDCCCHDAEDAEDKRGGIQSS